MKLYIVTVATNYDGYLPYLKHSCTKYNYDLVILGFGEKWKGFNWRYKLVLNFLDSINNEDIVCFIDGFDVICCKNLNNLSSVFNNLKKKYNCKIIVSEHKFVNNFKNYCAIFKNTLYFSKCKNRLINAGTYIGNVKDIKKILFDIYNLSPYDNSDDQKLLTIYCKNNEKDVYIDSNNEIFLVLEDSYEEIDKSLLFYKDHVIYNNNSPFFIHGAGETLLDNIIIKLNYNYDYNNKVRDNIIKNYYNKTFFRIKNLDFNIIVFTFIFIFIFIFIIIIIIFNKKLISKYYKKNFKK